MALATGLPPFLWILRRSSREFRESERPVSPDNPAPASEDATCASRSGAALSPAPSPADLSSRLRRRSRHMHVSQIVVSATQKVKKVCMAIGEKDLL